MKRLSLLAIAIILGVYLCIGQSRKTDKFSVSKQLKTENDSINRPQENIKVNKEYDKNGNLISYDSTYSYSYSSSSMDEMDPQKKDSLLNEFKSFFKESGSMCGDSFFNDFFAADSVGNSSLFSSQVRENLKQINKQFSQLDSIRSHKNTYINKTVPKIKNKSSK